MTILRRTLLAVFLSMTFFASSTFAQSRKGDLVPIQIRLPHPLFIGMTQHWDIPNLEKPSLKPRPPFLAPEGTYNVALHQSVTSSDEHPEIGELDMITDGDNEGSDGHYVQLAPSPQWVQIDLGAEYRIYGIVIWHYHKQPRVYFDIIVQVSNDKNFFNGVKTLFNNDNDNSTGLGVGKDKNYVETYLGKLITAKGVKARYVRCYSNGNNSNDLNHYVEVEVYGKPVE